LGVLVLNFGGCDGRGCCDFGGFAGFGFGGFGWLARWRGSLDGFDCAKYALEVVEKYCDGFDFGIITLAR
jgi:hypothetical protein